jgi:hypothetical protein
VRLAVLLLVSGCMPDLLERDWRVDAHGLGWRCSGTVSTLEQQDGSHAGAFIAICTNGGAAGAVSFRDEHLELDLGEDRILCDDLTYSLGGIVLSCFGMDEELQPADITLTAIGGAGGQPTFSPQ